MSNGEAVEKFLLEIENHRRKYELSKNLPDDWYEPGMMENLDKFYGLYSPETNSAVLVTEVKGLRYEGRTQRLEKLTVGDQVKLVREPENKFNSNNFLITGLKSENLGVLSAQLCNVLAPLYDSGVVSITESNISYLERICDRSRYARQGVLFIRIAMHINASVEPRSAF